MGGFTFNPVLSEIQSHMAAMSPAAQAAVKMANPSIPSPEASAQPRLSPGMLLPHPDAGPPGGNINMGSPQPLISMPSSTPQLVTGPKAGQAILSNGEQPSPMQSHAVERNRLLAEPAGVDQIASRIQGTGFGQEHPLAGRLLGDTAQTLGKIGDTALNVGASLGFPALNTLARDIPGTTQHHEQLLGRADAAVTQDEANAQREAQTASENATAQHTNAETPEVAPNAESARALQGAETAHDEAETTALGRPQLEVHDTEDGPILINKATGDAQHVTVDGQPVGPKLKLTESQPIMGPDKQPHTYMIDEKGNKVVDLGVHYEKPNVAPGITMIVPNGQGGGTVERLTQGQSVAPGAQTAAGVNAVNTPTMQQRTAAGRAGTVVAMAPEVLSRIDALAPKLGPVEGRWNEFMQGRVGSDDPDFAALRSDLLMMSSAVALAHAQGRLPENLREEFDRAINAPKQTPANLKATIQTMLPWLQKMQNQGQPNAPQGGGSNDPLGIR